MFVRINAITKWVAKCYSDSSADQHRVAPGNNLKVIEVKTTNIFEDVYTVYRRS